MVQMKQEVYSASTIVFLSIICTLLLGQLLGYAYLKRKTNGSIGDLVERVMIFNIAVGILGLAFEISMYDSRIRNYQSAQT